MKSVVICGSNKFADEVRAFSEGLKKLGVVVYIPHFYRASGGRWDELKDSDKPFVALGLTHDHFNKIRMAEVVFIYNKGGYAGNSTTLEIGYAVALGKPIYALSHDNDELCRDVLFQEIVGSPEELASKL